MKTAQTPIPGGIKGFTLVELIITISVIMLLAGISLPVMSSIDSNKKQVAEVGAAKNVIAAYLAYAADNNGELMPGFPANTVSGQDGRWPTVLSPYLGDDFVGTVVVNKSMEGYKKSEDPAYYAALYPSLGLNITFLGGNYGGMSGEPTVDSEYGEHVVTHLAQAHEPSKLIAFVSARRKDKRSGPWHYGNYHVLSPYLTGLRWSKDYKETDLSSRFGNVHPRYNGKAIAAHLDGTIALLDTNELKDMRRWCNTAAVENSPTFTLK